MAKRPPVDLRAAELAGREAALAEMPDQVALLPAMPAPAPAIEQMDDRSSISVSGDEEWLSDDDVAYLREHWGIAADATPHELLSAGIGETQAAMYRILRAGAHFLLLRQMLPHGEFLPAVAATGLIPQRAREAMRLERARLRLPAEQREKFLAAPKTKVLMIASLDAETADQILGGEQFEQWMALPKRALAEQIKKLRQQNEALIADKEIADAKLKAATNDNPAAKLTKVDLWRRRKKLAAHGLTELAQRTALEAGRLLAELSEPQWLPTNADDALADKSLCTSIAAEVMAAKAAWDEVLGALQVNLKGRMSLRADDIPVMTRAEIDEARTRRASMAEFTQRELDNITALNYARDALDDATERGATPKAFRKLRHG